MALTEKELELVLLSSSMAAGCVPCTKYHLGKVNELQVCNNNTRKTITNTKRIYEELFNNTSSIVLKQRGIELDNDENISPEESTRLMELVSLAASFTSNSTAGLKKHIELARMHQVSDQEILKIFDLTLSVKMKAESQIEKIIDEIKNNITGVGNENSTNNCGCGEGNPDVDLNTRKTSDSLKGKTNKEDSCC